MVSKKSFARLTGASVAVGVGLAMMGGRLPSLRRDMNTPLSLKIKWKLRMLAP